MESLSWMRELSSRIDVDKMLKLTCQLIEKKTVNPPGNEHLVKDIIVECLKELKARIKIEEPSPGRCNILGYIGEGKPEVAIISHMDVVPPGEGWESDPFLPRVKEGKIYGRGAVDNKGPYAASWAAVKAIVSSNLPFKGTIILGAVADEEKGSAYGMKYLLKKGFSPDFCIIPDGGSLNEIVIGEKGRIEAHIKTKGRSAHASQPEKGENAIYKMAEYLVHLKKLKLEGEFHHLFDPPTINVGEIKGGEAPNIVADSCKITIDIRYPWGMEEEDIILQLQSLAHHCGIEIKIEEDIFSIKPHLLDKKIPLIENFETVANSIGIKLKLGTMGGITLAKNLYFSKIPSVVHSPDTNSVAHQANEYVDIDNLVICAKLWAGVIYKTLNSNKG